MCPTSLKVEYLCKLFGIRCIGYLTFLFSLSLFLPFLPSFPPSLLHCLIIYNCIDSCIVIFILGYNPTILYILLPLGALSVGSHVPLTSLWCVCFFVLMFMGSSLLSGATRCSRSLLLAYIFPALNLEAAIFPKIPHSFSFRIVLKTKF